MSAPWLALAVASIVGLVSFVVADRPVRGRRLAAFASRHRIAVSAANVAHLVRYLRLTRRWRCAGVTAGLAVPAVYALQYQRVDVSVVLGLTGWFLGAIVAEARAAGPAPTRRVASLQRRSIAQYASSSARFGLVAATALCLLLAALAAASGLPPVDWIVPLLAGAAIPPLVLFVAQRVALRPQPVDSAELLAADDAVRRSSTQVLHAAAATLMLYAAAWSVAALAARYTSELAAALVLLTAIGIPLLGWRLGRAGYPRPAGLPSSAR